MRCDSLRNLKHQRIRGRRCSSKANRTIRTGKCQDFRTSIKTMPAPHSAIGCEKQVFSAIPAGTDP